MNIEDYEFSDSSIVFVDNGFNDFVALKTEMCVYEISLRKSDVIALAKHFKLTTNDIEEK